MYVCMYVYVRTSGVACVCAFVHVCMYVRMMYVRMCTWVHVSCMRWASHESYTRLHTHIQCCCTLCYCYTMPSLLVRDESAHTTCMRWASHESYTGLHTHKRCCCTLCYCSTTPSLLVHNDTVRTKLLALQTDSSARGTPCTMCTPSMHSPNNRSLKVAVEMT